MFADKYRKYKRKYLRLKKIYDDKKAGYQFNNNDNDGKYEYIERVEESIDDDHVERPESNDGKHPFYVNPDDDENVEVTNGIEYVDDLRNDDNTENVNYSDGIELKETIVIKRDINRTEISDIEYDAIDIGGYGLARGVMYKEDTIDVNNDTIQFKDGQNKNKILTINDIDSFDEFTEEYGALNEYGDLYIKWDKVSSNYKGFYLDTGLYNDRFDSAFYKRKMIPSWWKFEYRAEGYVIFVKKIL